MKRIALLFVLLLIAAAATAGWFYLRLTRPYRGYEAGEQFVEVSAGAGSRAIGERLVAGGVVPDSVTFRLGLWLSGKGRRLEAGEYRFDHAMTPLEVIDKIARGDVYVINVTFPEGLNANEMARIFEMHGLGAASAFLNAARDTSAVRANDPKAPDLEGYLFPDTYPLPRRVDAPKVVHLMTDRFARVWTPEIQQAADALGFSMRQVMTLASIVEKETARPDERPIVAAVYENRLKIGMALQCDPTVIYALARAGRYTGNLRRDDLTFDSPYNTYRYPGLPPGPIASPGQSSIEAVVHPAPVDYLYFVSRNDGSHVFARSLDEHNRNVQRWQVEYFRSRR